MDALHNAPAAQFRTRYAGNAQSAGGAAQDTKDDHARSIKLAQSILYVAGVPEDCIPRELTIEDVIRIRQAVPLEGPLEKDV